MFKTNNKKINFPNQLCLGSVYTKFDYVDSKEVCLKGNVYGFLVDYNTIGKSEILNTHKYLMVKNNNLMVNNKIMFGFI